VQTRSGETIYELKPEQFVVEDNGVRQKIRVDEEPEAQGLSLVVVVQCSRSAGSHFGKLAGLGTMVEEIAGAGPHEIAVVSYGDGPTLAGGFSRGPDDLQRALSKVKPCNDYGAATLDTVNYAAHLLEGRPRENRRAILLVSETRDHGSRASTREVIGMLGASNTVIYSVAFSPTRDEALAELKNEDQRISGAALAVAPPGHTESNPASREEPLNSAAVISHEDARSLKRPPLFELPPTLLMAANALRQNVPKELARLSGGEYMNFASQKAFDGELGLLASRVHNFYAISFQPAGDAPMGFHSLRVTVPDHPDAVIQTRTSYWSSGGSANR
jgi:VWFA-related protein